MTGGENEKVQGVISDSDIRKQIVLPGKNPLDLKAKSLMRSDFFFLYDFELENIYIEYLIFELIL